MRKGTNNDLAPHVIVLPSYAPIAVCLTKRMAESYAGQCFPDGKYTIREAVKQDLEILLEDYFTVEECK